MPQQRYAHDTNCDLDPTALFVLLCARNRRPRPRPRPRLITHACIYVILPPSSHVCVRVRVLPTNTNSYTQVNLECQISDYVDQGKITPGSANIATRGASSYVAILKEHQIQDNNKPGVFFREFYCENWTSPNNVWQIVYISKVRSMGK